MRPCVLSNEAVALELSEALEVSICEPAIANKSGPPSENRVKPTGISPPFSPVKIVSTPRVLAAVSDNSTMIASTRT